MLSPALKIIAAHPGLAEKDLVEKLAEAMGVSAEDRRELRSDIKSRKRRFDWRLHTVLGELDTAGLIEGRDQLKYITGPGRKLLDAAAPVTFRVLQELPAFQLAYEDLPIIGWTDDGEMIWPEDGMGGDAVAHTGTYGPTPDHPAASAETLEKQHEILERQLATSLLEKLKATTPAAFEQVVVDVLVAMNYGGSEYDAAQRVGGTGDGGIDGIIKEDPLGLDVIYIQAKRWQGNVGRPDIQQFVGALHAKRARKGVFITTSDFTPDAQKYVQEIEAKVVLMNGATLASIMIERNVGVTTRKVLPIKEISDSYFDLKAF